MRIANIKLLCALLLALIGMTTNAVFASAPIRDNGHLTIINNTTHKLSLGLYFWYNMYVPPNLDNNKAIPIPAKGSVKNLSFVVGGNHYGGSGNKGCYVQDQQACYVLNLTNSRGETLGKYEVSYQNMASGNDWTSRYSEDGPSWLQSSLAFNGDEGRNITLTISRKF